MTTNNNNGWKSRSFWLVLSLLLAVVSYVFVSTVKANEKTNDIQDSRISALEVQSLKTSVNIARICEALKVHGCQP